MSTIELVELIDKLPEEKKKAVQDFVTGLLENKEDKPVIPENKPKMRFGDLKGFVTYISDDFDEPMKEFKEYM